MSIFGRDKDGRERAHDVPPAFGTPTDAVRPREVAMGERDRGTGQPGGIDAFLGKGTTISGKLVFEGPGRIEGKVEGEIAAHDTLTVGEGAVVNAKVSVARAGPLGATGLASFPHAASTEIAHPIA